MGPGHLLLPSVGWRWPSQGGWQQLAAIQLCQGHTALRARVPAGTSTALHEQVPAAPWDEIAAGHSVSKLQILLRETEPAQCQETDKAYAKSQPSEGIKQLLEERQWLNKVQQMMPINKFSIIKGHLGSQKEAAKSCNHTILQYPLQKVEKHIIYFGCKRTRRADYLRKLQPATKTSLSAFYLREWGCISDPISYFRWIISLNHTAVICLHVFLWHHYILLSLTPSETDNLWGLLMGQNFP